MTENERERELELEIKKIGKYQAGLAEVGKKLLNEGLSGNVWLIEAISQSLDLWDEKKSALEAELKKLRA